MDLFWTGTAATDDALTQCIARQRRALGEDKRNPAYLKTVSRIGYRFVDPMEEVFGESFAVLEVTPSRALWRPLGDRVGGPSQPRPPTPPYVLGVYGGFF